MTSAFFFTSTLRASHADLRGWGNASHHCLWNEYNEHVELSKQLLCSTHWGSQWLRWSGTTTRHRGQVLQGRSWHYLEAVIYKRKGIQITKCKNRYKWKFCLEWKKSLQNTNFKKINTTKITKPRKLNIIINCPTQLYSTFSKFCMTCNSQKYIKSI